MEGRAVVCTRGAKSQEIFGRLGDRFTEDLDFQVTVSGMELWIISNVQSTKEKTLMLQNIL
jgi:phenylalanyl-tRNA synthetase beta subunit